jgi:hypothetical protein
MAFQYTFRSDDITTWDVDTRDLLENRDRELELYSINLEQSTVPIGAITLWAGDTTALPTGYVLCDGASYSNASTYLALFNVLGYKYGGSSGNFNVPSFPTGNIPFGTTTLNSVASRNAITVSTGTFASTGHIHTFGDVLTNGASNTHSHPQNSVATNTQSANHTHPQNSVNTGNVSADHSHNFSVNSGNDSVNHSHSYLKGSTGDNTGGSNAFHSHVVSGGTSGISANHFHTTNATNTGNISANHTHNTIATNTGGQSTTHNHSSTALVNATTPDLTHSHTAAGNYVVYIIKYV